jgi:hypothetical protein
MLWYRLLTFEVFRGMVYDRMMGIWGDIFVGVIVGDKNEG